MGKLAKEFLLWSLIILAYGVMLTSWLITTPFTALLVYIDKKIMPVLINMAAELDRSDV